GCGALGAAAQGDRHQAGVTLPSSATFRIEDSMQLNLQGRTVLITVASRGIGEAVAVVMAAEGCNLMLTARDGEKLEQVAKDIRQRHGGQVATHVFDLSKHENIAALAPGGGDCDILANN